MNYDLVIIGGGINGCALARLAAVNGFSVALLEKNDFGSGVTSRSTRLIHGGLRYLENGRIGLVKESLNDRQALLREYPGQVKPQAFLIPVYQSDSRRPFYISIGLHIYKWLAGDPELAEFQRLSAQEVSALAPALDTRDLLAGFLYRDCQAVYPERLSLEMALQAEEAGAEIHNHAAVDGFLIESRCVEGVRVTGLDCAPTLRARLVINAAGPWVDKVRPALPESTRKPLVSRLNGTHIVVRPFAGAALSVVYHEARSDRRPFFVIPWRGLSLIGATETPFCCDPDRVIPAEREIAYLLEEANGLFPGARLTRESVLYAYAGSRPLLHGRSGSMNAASRDHSIYDHEKEEGLKGLLTLLGGKLTTAPSFAWEVLTAASKKLGAPHPASREKPSRFKESVRGSLSFTARERSESPTSFNNSPMDHRRLLKKRKQPWARSSMQSSTKKQERSATSCSGARGWRSTRPTTHLGLGGSPRSPHAHGAGPKLTSARWSPSISTSARNFSSDPRRSETYRRNLNPNSCNRAAITLDACHENSGSSRQLFRYFDGVSGASPMV